MPTHCTLAFDAHGVVRTAQIFPLPEVVGLWVQGLAIFVVDSLCCPRGIRVALACPNQAFRTSSDIVVIERPYLGHGSTVVIVPLTVHSAYQLGLGIDGRLSLR